LFFIQRYVQKLCRFIVIRRGLLLLYFLVGQLFVLVFGCCFLVQRIFLKVIWREIWPGSSDLDFFLTVDLDKTSYLNFRQLIKGLRLFRSIFVITDRPQVYFGKIEREIFDQVSASHRQPLVSENLLFVTRTQSPAKDIFMRFDNALNRYTDTLLPNTLRVSKKNCDFTRRYWLSICNIFLQTQLAFAEANDPMAPLNVLLLNISKDFLSRPDCTTENRKIITALLGSGERFFFVPLSRSLAAWILKITMEQMDRLAQEITNETKKDPILLPIRQVRIDYPQRSLVNETLVSLKKVLSEFELCLEPIVLFEGPEFKPLYAVILPKDRSLDQKTVETWIDYAEVVLEKLGIIPTIFTSVAFDALCEIKVFYGLYRAAFVNPHLSWPPVLSVSKRCLRHTLVDKLSAFSAAYRDPENRIFFDLSCGILPFCKAYLEGHPVPITVPEAVQYCDSLKSEKLHFVKTLYTNFDEPDPKIYIDRYGENVFDFYKEVIRKL